MTGAVVDTDSLLVASLVDAWPVLASVVPAVVVDPAELDAVVALDIVVPFVDAALDAVPPLDAVPSFDDEPSSSMGDVASPQLEHATRRTRATTRDITPHHLADASHLSTAIVELT